MAHRVGVMGGTFNPVHLGHLRAAEEAVEMLALDAFLFIPAAVPPHKGHAGIAPFSDRMRMVALSIAGHPAFRASNLEERLPGPSYTARTLRALKDELPPASEIYFLVGLDAFFDCANWWSYRELFSLARMAVMRRPGKNVGEMGLFLTGHVSPLYAWDPALRVFSHPEFLPVAYLETSALEVSSSRIRELCRAGRSIRWLVPPAVMEYIEAHGLYR